MAVNGMAIAKQITSDAMRPPEFRRATSLDFRVSTAAAAFRLANC